MLPGISGDSPASVDPPCPVKRETDVSNFSPAVIEWLANPWVSPRLFTGQQQAQHLFLGHRFPLDLARQILLPNSCNCSWLYSSHPSQQLPNIRGRRRSIWLSFTWILWVASAGIPRSSGK